MVGDIFVIGAGHDRSWRQPRHQHVFANVWRATDDLNQAGFVAVNVLCHAAVVNMTDFEFVGVGVFVAGNYFGYHYAVIFFGTSLQVVLTWHLGVCPSKSGVSPPSWEEPRLLHLPVTGA